MEEVKYSYKEVFILKGFFLYLSLIYFYILKLFLKKFNYFYLNLIFFLIFLNYFDTLILKGYKIYYFKDKKEKSLTENLTFFLN